VTRVEEACPQVTPAERARFGQVQAYEDAIAYRRARLAVPCADCDPARCDDHAADANLIAVYRRAAASCPAGPHGPAEPFSPPAADLGPGRH
jgi:hypothetical protein